MLYNEAYGKKISLFARHGITHDESLMKEAPHEGPWYYEQIELGYNYRLTDFQAGLLLSQLRKIDKFRDRRDKIVKMPSSLRVFRRNDAIDKNVRQLEFSNGIKKVNIYCYKSIQNIAY